jgi:SAM-dependent methyltransferase
MTILEPGGAGPPSRLLAQCRRYIPTKYEELTAQEIEAGVRREDLRSLSLGDGSVDLVVTSDVFEHVVDPGPAFREIARVLRHGGAHVFTLPIYDRPETVVRIDDDGRELMEVTYHGPYPVVREWGDDVVSFVEAQAGTPTERLQPFSRWHGIRGIPLYEHGPMIDVLVSRKVGASAASRSLP